jgi:hypothetical protein
VQVRPIPYDREGVRSEAVARRLQDGEGDGGSQRRVNRIAALMQHSQASLGRERLRCSHHIVGQHR